jgi:serine/threonine protein kinase
MRDIEIKYKIGHGEYGQVYRADFTDSKGKTIPVAIKQLKQNDNLKESKIMASLNHSCIVKFYGFCEKRMIVSEIFN